MCQGLLAGGYVIINFQTDIGSTDFNRRWILNTKGYDETSHFSKDGCVRFYKRSGNWLIRIGSVVLQDVVFLYRILEEKKGS